MADASAATDIRRLTVLHVRRGPVEFDTKVPPAAFDFGEGGPRFEGGIRVLGNVTIVDDSVIAQARVCGLESSVCARCLEDVKKTFEREFFLAFELGGERYIDLLPHLREEMLLEQPLQMLCRPECRGLCARCGTNLNTGSCQCAERSSSS